MLLEDTRYEIASHGDLAIYYLRPQWDTPRGVPFTIDYLISSIRPLYLLWLNNERRVMKIYFKYARYSVKSFV